MAKKPQQANTSINRSQFDPRDGMDWEDWHRLDQEERDYIQSATMAREAKKLQRFQAIASVYQTADSVLTRSSVSVVAGDFSGMEGIGEAPAFNDGKTIYLNTDVLLDIDDNSLISLNGINYHEVAHILWSPRGNSEFGRKVTKAGYQQAFNILEDMRIETLMTARFPSTRMSLTKSVLDYIMSSPDPSGSFALVRGRRYLPLEVRQLSANLFTNKFGRDKAVKVADLIDEYRLLTYPASYERGYEIIEQFNSLMELLGAPPECGGCGTRPMLKSGRPEGGAQQSNIAGRANGMNDKAEDIPSEEQSGNAGAGRQGENGTPQDYDPMMKRDSMSEAFAEAVRNAIQSVMKSKQAKTEARQLRSAIREADRKASGDTKINTRLTPVDNAYRVASKAFGEELSRLRIDNDPHWEIEKPVGRLNINRVMNMDINDINTVFDQWNEGRDDYNIEAVIMCDTSGSMGNIITETMQSMWAIKRALENIDGKVTVLSFSDTTKTIYNSNELATSQYRFAYDGGGTSPLDGLMDVEALLGASRRKTKLLFIITDGEWSQDNDCNRTIERINDIDGVISQVVFITSQEWIANLSPDELHKRTESYRHKAHAISLVSKPTELLDVARNILRSL